MDELLSQLTSAPKEHRKTPPQSQPKAPQTPARPQMPQYAPRTEPPKFDLTTTNPIINERIRIARRQTLQYAPKVGSPLARSWKA